MENLEVTNQKHYYTSIKTIAIIFIVIQCSVFTFGAQLYYVNTSKAVFEAFINSSLTAHYNYSPSDHAMDWIWTSMLGINYLTQSIGNLLSPKILESKFGRLGGFIVASVIECTTAIGFFLAIQFNIIELFAIMRLIMGFGNAINISSGTMFVQECTPTIYRGLCSCFQVLCILAAGILGLILGMPFVLGNENDLKYLVLTPALANIILVLLALFALKESPKHLLLTRVNIEAAEEAIKFYHGKCNTQEIIEAIRLEKLNHEGNKANMIDIFRVKHIRMGFLIGLAAMLLQTFSGIYMLSMFSTDMFSNSGLSATVAQWSTVGLVVVNLIFSAISASVIERFGRRPLLLGSDIFTLIFFALFAILSALGLHYESISNVTGICGLVALLLFNAAFSLGIGPIPFFICSEVVPTHYRSIANGLAQSINLIFVMLLTFVQFPLYASVGPLACIALFSVPSIVFWIFIYRNLPETRDKEIGEIVQQMMR